MIANLYIHCASIWKLNGIKALLRQHDVSFFDATEYDSYTSGFNKADSLQEIEQDLQSQVSLCMKEETILSNNSSIKVKKEDGTE